MEGRNVESRKVVQNSSENTQLEEHETSGTDRRGFLRQAASAGVGSAALTLLMGAAGSKRAEAGPPPQVTVQRDMWDITVKLVQDVTTKEVFHEVNLHWDNPGGSTLNDQKLQIPNGGNANFQFPAAPTAHFDAAKVPIYAGWYTLVGDLRNFSRFRLLDVDIDGSGTMWMMTISPLADAETVLTIKTYMSHGPV
jgi:hypothetical protein